MRWLQVDELDGTTQERGPKQEQQSARRVWRMALGGSDVVHLLVRVYVWSVDLGPRKSCGVLVAGTGEFVPSSASAEGDHGFILG